MASSTTAMRSDGIASSSKVVYPESDGAPIGESDNHIAAILYLRQALRFVFRDVADLYVAADMIFYYEEGDPESSVVPDVFAVKGVAKHSRRTYKLWEEGVVPSTVIEVTSKSSRVQDLGTKKGLYEMLGVSEYLVFDPLGEYLEPRFRAFELGDGYYQPANLESDGSYRSEQLEMSFRPVDDLLRVIDPSTEEPVPQLDEAALRAEKLERKLKEYEKRYGKLE